VAARNVGQYESVTFVRSGFVRRLFVFGCGGAVVPLALAHVYWAIALVTVLYVLLEGLRVDRVFALVASIHRGGLRITIPVAPLVGGVLDKDKTRRHMAVATTMMQKAVQNQREVDLLLCSGWRAVGWDRDPGWIYQTLLATGQPLRLRVLLLDPACVEGVARGEQVMQGHPPDRYTSGTHAVLWTLRQLAELGARVEVRFYTEAPIWQMIILPTEIWLMSATAHTPTDLSPMWLLARNRPYGMAQGLEAVFDRRWLLGEANKVDLTTMSKPAVDSVVRLPPAWE
jgi:hypothetical protein